MIVIYTSDHTPRHLSFPPVTTILSFRETSILVIASVINNKIKVITVDVPV